MSTMLAKFEHRSSVISFKSVKFYPFTPDTNKLLLGCFANSEELIAASQTVHNNLYNF